MSTLIIKDLLPLDNARDDELSPAHSLTPEEMRRISGGRYAAGMLNGDEGNLVSFDIDKWNFDQFMRGAL